MRDRSHDEAIAELFREDLNPAAQRLSEMLLDGEQGEMLIVLRQLAMATGELGKTKREAKNHVD